MRLVRTAHAVLRRSTDRLKTRPALILGISLGGLLIAIAIAGVVGLAINRNVQEITADALAHEVDLDDEGDDLRAAVLDVRHYHRDLVLLTPGTQGAVTRFEDAYASLREEIADYGRIQERAGLATAADLLLLAERYYDTFRPAIALHDTDPTAFTQASETGLDILGDLELEVEAIERVGEEEANAALQRVDDANGQARLILMSVLGGMVLIGGGLAWATLRVMAIYRELYEVQRDLSTKLAGLSRAKTDFIADASHELRTPLAILRGNAEAGLALDSTCVHRDILSEIVAESVQMSKLVDDLLFLARSDADAAPLHFEPVEAELFLIELAERARMLAEHHDRAFEMTLAGQGTLRADQSRLAQAVMALIDNAAKYSPVGSCVRLTSATRGTSLVIEVINDGPGLPEGSLSSIFDRFVRIDQGRSRSSGGAGLGLAIAKTIVDAHDGRIEIRSSPGAGTTARIVIPLASEGTQPVSRGKVPAGLAPGG